MEHEFRIRAEIVSGGIEAAERSADYDTAGLSQQGGVTGVAPSGWTSWSGTRRPTQPFCGRFPAGKELYPTEEQLETLSRDGAGANVCRTETGWEEERDIYLRRPVWIRRCPYWSGWLLILLGTLVGMVALRTIWSGLAAALERGQGADPVKDAPPRPTAPTARPCAESRKRRSPSVIRRTTMRKNRPGSRPWAEANRSLIWKERRI